MEQGEKIPSIIGNPIKLLGVPPSFTSSGQYSRTSKLQLPFTSLVEEYNVGKARLVMTPKDSKDEKVRAVYNMLTTPTNLHKWKLTETPDCPLCGARGNLQHIISSCSIVLSRYRKGDTTVYSGNWSCDWETTKEIRTRMQFVKEG